MDRGRRVVFVTVCEKLVSKIPDRVSSRVFYSGLGANPKLTQGQMGFPMAGRSIQMSIASVLFIVILSFANVCNGFYLPGSYLQTYPNLEPNLAVVLGVFC